MPNTYRIPAQQWSSYAALTPLPHPSWGRLTDSVERVASITAPEFWSRLGL
ncbi:hypothetical protein [Altererythrobacter sp. Root672]|uniref:hypothetical protein n=1 Tax=Altererythrobacter sp. Root672 TaxID=1736584 RepID=UPI000B11098A|nr:hypothetical protein [Altererythrobacter sp. Root672]